METGRCVEKCSICGEERDVDHKYKLVDGKAEQRCTVCGFVKNVEQHWIDTVLKEYDLMSQIDKIKEMSGKQHTLAVLAIYANNIGIRRVATDCLTNQETLAMIAKNESGSAIRQSAVRRLESQQLLEDIAQHDQDYEVRREAVERLSNQNLLDKISRSDSNEYVRFSAALRIANGQAILAQLVKTSKDYSIRGMAIDELTDQELLADLVKNAPNSYDRSAIIAKISDASLLNEIAQNDMSTEVRLKAAKTATTNDSSTNAVPDSKELEKRTRTINAVLDSHSDKETRLALVNRITDKSILFEIALMASSWLDAGVVDEVMKKMHEQDRIITLARKAEWAGTRIRAIHLIEDTSIVKDIAKNDMDEDVRKAAQKL